LRIDPQDRYQSFDDIVDDMKQMSGIDIQDKRDYDPSVIPLFFNSLRAGSLCSLGYIKESKATWKKAHNISCNTFEDFFSKGFVLSVLGQKKEDIECFNKAFEIDPQHIEVYNKKGLALSDIGQKKEAIECFNKAFEIDPNTEDMYDNKEYYLFALVKVDNVRICMQSN